MPEESGPRILSRRSALMLAAAGLLDWNRLYASAPDFWNKKPPSEWTPEEIDRLLTKSPWARQVTAQYAAGGEREAGRGAPNGGGYPGGGYPGGSGGGQRGGIGIGGIGIGMPRGRGGTGGGRGGERRTTTSSYTGTVRWESARPILDAAKTPLPEAFADHYVISVSGIPLLIGRRASQDEDANSSQAAPDRLDDLKQFTTLQPKGKEIAQAGVVHQELSSGTILLFGFSRDVLALTAGDQEVDFATRFGRLILKTKFNPKEMLYHGQLAL